MENEKQENLIKMNPADLLQLAVTTGADVDKLEKLMDLKLKWEANEARKAYFDAMARFKLIPLEIIKDRKVDFKHREGSGSTSYTHASLANVTETISKALAECGLSASWRTAQPEGQIEVTCRLAHREGHYEEISLKAPADTSGKKNPIQAIGSAVAYLERYTLLAISGMATKDMDDDGLASGNGYITEKQAEEIRGIVQEIGEAMDFDQFLIMIDATDIDHILANNYETEIKKLTIRTKALKKKAS